MITSGERPSVKVKNNCMPNRNSPQTKFSSTSAGRHRIERSSIVYQSQVARTEPDSSKYNNYEYSWLKFNFRVLQQAIDIRNPLLERVKFIGIVGSNLDEFFQKRVGGLKRQLQAGINNLSLDEKTPTEQLKTIRNEVIEMIGVLRGTFFDILVPEMSEQGIHFKQYAELTAEERDTVDEYFDKQLYPILTPLVVDHAHPFPLISNKSRSFAVELIDSVTGESLFARVKIPANRPRWILASKHGNNTVFILIDDLIRAKIERLFPGADIVSAHVFRVTRNADIERNEEEAEDLLELIEEELRERRFAEVVRLEIDCDAPPHIRKLLMDKMEIEEIDVFNITGPIGLADAVGLYKLKGHGHLKYKKWIPALHPVFSHNIDEPHESIFSIMRKGDFLTHHPYHSFASSVQRFIEEAACDPNVLAIKQTLYRTSKDSALMHALMRAAEDGKQVAVLVELKARFDEERNIEWAQKLEKAGVHVAYGIAGLKIHSKMTVVVRQENEVLRRYVHLGTGNYHPDTAQLYEDIGLFTCDEAIASDVTDLFNYLTGFAPNQIYSKLLVAPHYMRNQITFYIDEEIRLARNGVPGRIIMKMNNLEDPLIIQKLYDASNSGVQIDCIVRSVCRLKPGVSGMSENIRVHSVIGRFLEHSRLYYFSNGGNDIYFIGSADMMHRNLDARVEALTPIESQPLKRYLQFVLRSYLTDNRLRWILKHDGNHHQIRVTEFDSEVSIQRLLMDHVSSGAEPVPRA
jgi:polyphosphate kinase